ncbi:aminoacyl tRNA synthase complex-interacting multifunctional protein 1 [Iris pallida]|uniref:Aminoacyl tRNA synthase complex-interacting multifunctional protein 1 n=2 Tax=Iris pallida TaxID=29817 RepID=A0AAX6GE74_IRIPA|nr:aminoacyl tRNA synthase complex-interacting multifunctional protein 1 [Iris pallida]
MMTWLRSLYFLRKDFNPPRLILLFFFAVHPFVSQLSEEDMQKFKNVIRWIDYIQERKSRRTLQLSHACMQGRRHMVPRDVGVIFPRLQRVTRGQDPPPHVKLQEQNKRNKV